MAYTRTYTYQNFLQYLKTTDGEFGKIIENYYYDYDGFAKIDPRSKHIREAERKYGKLDEAFV